MSDLQGNLTKVEAYLARFKRDGVLNQIGGEAATEQLPQLASNYRYSRQEQPGEPDRMGGGAVARSLPELRPEPAHATGEQKGGGGKRECGCSHAHAMRARTRQDGRRRTHYFTRGKKKTIPEKKSGLRAVSVRCRLTRGADSPCIPLAPS